MAPETTEILRTALYNVMMTDSKEEAEAAISFTPINHYYFQFRKIFVLTPCN